MREQFGDEEETQGVSTSMRKAAICIKKRGLLFSNPLKLSEIDIISYP